MEKLNVEIADRFSKEKPAIRESPTHVINGGVR